MRKFLVPLLLLSCAAPAMADPGPRDRGDRAARELSASSDDDTDVRRKAAVQPDQPSRPDSSRARGDGDRRAAPQDQPRPAPSANRSGDTRRERTDGRRQEKAVRTWRERDRQQTTRPPLERGEAPVFGRSEQQRTPTVRNNARRPSVDLSQRTVANQWRNNWRRDSRYDWRSHRARNRSLYRLGYYYDPFGYNYRRFGYGYTLYPSYYSNRYWLNDPFMYRLPPAWGPYRWVRYWDDALLVDMRTGMVVDAIYDFFW